MFNTWHSTCSLHHQASLPQGLHFSFLITCLWHFAWGTWAVHPLSALRLRHATSTHPRRMQLMTRPHRKLRIKLQVFKALIEALELGSEEATLQDILHFQEALHGIPTKPPFRSSRGYQDQHKLLFQSLCSIRVNAYICSAAAALTQCRRLTALLPDRCSCSAVGQPKALPDHVTVMYSGIRESPHCSVSSSNSNSSDSHTALVPLFHQGPSSHHPHCTPYLHLIRTHHHFYSHFVCMQMSYKTSTARTDLEGWAVQLGTLGKLLWQGEAAEQQQQDSSPLQQALQRVAHHEGHKRPLHMRIRLECLHDKPKVARRVVPSSSTASWTARKARDVSAG